MGKMKEFQYQDDEDLYIFECMEEGIELEDAFELLIDQADREIGQHPK